jgi:hypothetical protein
MVYVDVEDKMFINDIKHLLFSLEKRKVEEL